MVSFLRAFCHDTSGSPATEYALMASLIAVALIGAFEALGGGITGLYNSLSAAM